MLFASPATNMKFFHRSPFIGSVGQMTMSWKEIGRSNKSSWRQNIFSAFMNDFSFCQVLRKIRKHFRFHLGSIIKRSARSADNFFLYCLHRVQRGRIIINNLTFHLIRLRALRRLGRSAINGRALSSDKDFFRMCKTFTFLLGIFLSLWSLRTPRKRRRSTANVTKEF